MFFILIFYFRAKTKFSNIFLSEIENINIDKNDSSDDELFINSQTSFNQNDEYELYFKENVIQKTVSYSILLSIKFNFLLIFI